MNETYFVIPNSDGDTTIDEVSKEELLKRLTPDKDGYNYYGTALFMDKLEEKNTNYWNEAILIIKGKIIQPIPTEVVKTYDI